MTSLLDNDKTWIQRDFGLDRRLVKALSKLGFIYPTLVQSRCIPIALQGKDVLVRARTGSGKTVAFSLPLLHKLLTSKEAESSTGGGGGGGGGSSSSQAKTQCVVLVPTKELCKQIEKHMSDLIYYCRDHVSIVALADDNTSVQQYRLQAKPDIIISTPAKLVQHLRSGTADVSHVKTLVIDEADLVLSFGYADDVHTITSKMPKIFQGLLMSATLSAELDKFKRVVLHNPAVLKLEEAQEGGGHLLQFYLSCKEADKFLTLYVFLKMGLLQGKGLIFVNDVNKCYRLKLFLQQFYISAAVLNSEVPLNSRMHILDEFNRGVFDYLIATDASLDDGEEDNDEDGDDDEDEEDEQEGAQGEEDEEEEEEEEEEAKTSKPASRKRQKGAAAAKKDAEDEDDDDNDDDDDDDDDDDEGDEEEEDGDDDDDDGDDEDEEEEAAAMMEAEESGDAAFSSSSSSVKVKKATKASSSSSSSEADYGVSRGIDFQDVSFVINFDFPKTSAAYTHRIGRTARGGASGTALSFVSTAAKGTNAAETEIANRDAQMLEAVRNLQPRLNNVEGDNLLAAMGTVDDPAFANSDSEESRKQPAPLMFNTKELESFRYRVEDTLRSVTVVAVKEFRAAELKREILNSSKLKSFFAENPNDLKVLRHDKAVLHPIRPKEHLKHVPEYLIPLSMRSVAQTNSGKKKRKRGQGQSADARVLKSKMRDPLLGAGSSEGGGGGGGEGGQESDLAAAGGGQEAGKERIYTSKEVSSGLGMDQSTSGRKKWQMRHKKGKFNPKAAKKGEHRMAGSFIKSKQYK